jgi:hypothetical protein
MTIQQSVNQTLSLASVLKRGAVEHENAQIRKDIAAQKQEKISAKAQEALRLEQERKRKTRRNFLQYMKDEPTNLGIKFGQLPLSSQKELAKEYTKGQRKAIMDRKDAMKK